LEEIVDLNESFSNCFFARFSAFPRWRYSATYDSILKVLSLTAAYYHDNDSN